MVCPRLVAFALLLSPIGAAPSAAQPETARARARPDYDRGIEQMRREAFEAAVRSFESAIRIDPTFDMALYMLGRTQMNLRNHAAAVRALSQCRDLHLAEASQRSQDRGEGIRLRRERIQEIERFIGELQRITPQTDRTREQIRQFQERKRQIENIDQETGLESNQEVPAYVSLSLGSAHFRTGNLAEAEKAYRETLAADSKVAEAYNNLAVVYMETGRYVEAERAVEAAEKAGLAVQQALKDEIRRRKGRIPL